MFERIIITFVVAGGLGLLWLGWQHYKMRARQTIQPPQVATDRPTLLYFTGEYCTACKFQQTPIVESISTKLGSLITVKKYDVSAQPELARQYKVLTLPTTIVLNQGGQITHINYGLAGQDKLEAQLRFNHDPVDGITNLN